MGKKHPAIEGPIREFIERQKMFFVATAPLDPQGSVNISPKGLDTFRILGPKSVAYLDLTGSGAETVAHLKENGRITLMFCALQGPPKILRLRGRGRAIEPPGPEFARLRSHFPEIAGARAIVLVEVDDISDSCGYGVPLFRYEGERDQYFAWAGKLGEQGLNDYQEKNNRQSIDGLPGLSR
ncbi:MAG TPA: pyridoxamine 5'-phosphate oxidase family protein [Candidatus Dormibacteraeota bacterium]|nr:pyridoxamine 5'-phosphate oxidase family protein [Candidatus Dormibacteraeota bacterium]